MNTIKIAALKRLISKVYPAIKPKLSTLIVSLSSFISFSLPAQTNIKPGRVFRDCPECPQMVVIPAGTFLMGTPDTEAGRDKEEGPQRQVSIKKFAAGRFDITRGEWKAFVKATNRPTTGGCAWSGLPADGKPWDLNDSASWEHLGFAQGDSDPVVCVNWDDTQDYVRWLSKLTGANYRLLTESEWEYAARAGSVTPFPWGTKPSHDYANYGADSGYLGLISGKDRWMNTSPVGSFPPNAFGLYDMHGNVLQYLEDCFHNSYSDLPADGSAYKTDVILKMSGDLAEMNGKSACFFRMVRGGDFGDPPKMIRSGYRNWSPGPGASLQNYRSSALGFRVAKTL